MTNENELRLLWQQLTAPADRAEAVSERAAMMEVFRSRSRQAARELDGFLVSELIRIQAGLNRTRETQEELRDLIDKLTAPPHHPAIYLGSAMDERGPVARVVHSNVHRVVGIAPWIAAGSIDVGDEVLLGSELNLVLAKSPHPTCRGGEMARFERFTDDGRMVLKWRDEEILVAVAHTLAKGELKAGDLVVWDRNAWMAFEKMERSRGRQLFLEDTPQESFDRIGGLDRQIQRIQRAIALHIDHGAVARAYGVKRKGSILLYGPPGTGKTMLARALANWLAGLSRSGRSRFINIKPASLHSSWYGETEANYREAFRVARQAGEEEPDVPVVMFFDEVDSIATVRGQSLMRVDDRVLTAFAAELDGLESRGNILVVAATNRRDMLDGAIDRPGRLGDLVLEVPRPNRRAAFQIFSKHLHPSIPYAGQSQPEEASTRAGLIEAAVSRLYAPNGDGSLATITFRDGRQRVVGAPELLSGATIAKIAQAAIERACFRHAESGERGVAESDLMWAIDEEMESLARGLTPVNCRHHVSGLPQDVDVVRVEPVEGRVVRPYRYLEAAS